MDSEYSELKEFCHNDIKITDDDLITFGKQKQKKRRRKIFIFVIILISLLTILGLALGLSLSKSLQKISRNNLPKIFYT